MKQRIITSLGLHAPQAVPTRLRIRVDLSPQCSIGPGKVSLLEAIEREGSLSVAARSIDMSYRRAWNLLDDLNQSFAQAVVSTSTGGLQGGGARLTDFGRELVKSFRALERAALPIAMKHLRKFRAVRKRRVRAARKPVTGRLRKVR